MKGSIHLGFLLVVLILVLVVVSNVAQAVPINGKEWRQLTETTGYSWNEVATVCPAGGGLCNGSLGSTDFTGWNWATRFEVLDLFSFFNTTMTYTGQNTIWAPEFFTKFNPTLFGSSLNQVVGWSSSSIINSSSTVDGFGNRPLVQDSFSSSGFDVMDISNFAHPDFSVFYYGTWLYKDVDTASVPEPSTYLLMGLGLLGLVYRKRSNFK